MTKQQVISAQILLKISAGMTIEQAIDAVIGSGAYEKLVGDTYDQLRK